MKTVYLDYNATTPLDREVRESMLPYLDGVYGNPSSIHHVGRAARADLDDARFRVAQVWSCKPSEVVFTSGGTESNNLAVFGVARLLRGKGRHLITSQVEHHSVLHCFQYLEKKQDYSVTYLPVNSLGQVDPSCLAAAIKPDTILVSIMAANNETGTLQPVAQLGEICRKQKVLFHTDAAQWFGKESVSDVHQFNADLVTLCAHKFYGPKGAGALFIRSPLLPDPLLFGGGHENERRAGTENLPAIIGLATAMERFSRQPVFPKEPMAVLTGALIGELEKVEGVTFRGSRDGRLSNTASFTVDRCDSISLLAGLDIEGICASSGSACSAGSLEPSHVLSAMGVPRELANSYVRFSLGRETTENEVAFVRTVFPKIVGRIRGN